MMKIGPLAFWTDPQNIQTIIFVTTGWLNGVYQYIDSPYSLTSKIIMVLNIVFAL
jgi:hypothetical protein